MRRGGTALVVLVVAAIALAAGIDALRGGDEPRRAAEPEPPPAASTTTSAPDEPVEAPTAAPELRGTLYFTDGNCQLQAIEIPGPTAGDAPNWDECRFVLSPDATRVAGAGSGWDPYSDPLIGRVFRSEDGAIQVSTNGGPEGDPFAGTAPAWRPDGTLTYFADGAVREWPSAEVVLSQYPLREALRRSDIPGLGGLRVRVREAAWLDMERLAVILDVDGPSVSWDVLMSFDGQNLEEAYVETPGRFADLRASTGGTYFAARRGQDGFIMAEPGRGEVDNRGIVGYRAITWSPDDSWVAVAADGGVFVFRPGFEGPPTLALDLDAHDLDWRGAPGLDAASADLDTSEAGPWLARHDARGTLLVTQQDGGACRLRALEIPGLEWAASPDAESPCRFTLREDGTVAAGGAPGIAITPEGRPTFVADGELFAGDPGNRAEQLVSAAKLEELFRAPAALEEVAWVDDERFWAVVRSEGADRIVLMTTEALVFQPWFAAPRIEGLRVGPGGLVAASSDRGVPLLGADGRRLIVANGLDVAWAPGEPLAAVSTREGILFAAPGTGSSVSLPLDVRDLDWTAG